MNPSPEKSSTSTSQFLKSIATVYPPIFAVVGFILYAVGLGLALTLDASLGVGPLTVSRERATILGLILMVLLLPTLLFWLNLSENMDDIAVESFFPRLKGVLLNIIFPLMASGFLWMVLQLVTGTTKPHLIAIGLTLPLFLLSSSVLIGPIEARRLVVYWPLLLPICAIASSAGIGQWLPITLGGHEGPKVIVHMSDSQVLRGNLKGGDSETLVLQIEGRNIAIFKRTIDRIESHATDYR